MKTGLKGATSRTTHLEKIGKIFQVPHSQSVLIFVSGNHPWLISGFYYSLVSFYVRKLLIRGFIQFETNQKYELKYRNIAHLSTSFTNFYSIRFGHLWFVAWWQETLVERWLSGNKFLNDSPSSGP